MTEVSQITSSDAGEVFASGRRYLAIKDYTNAVSTLGRACELLASKHGEQADECAEPYLWYGKALLGLSREESGVFGDRVPQVDEAEKESDEDQDENDDEEEDSENGEHGDAGKDKDGNTKETEEGASKTDTEAVTSNDEPGTSSGGGGGEANGDESAVDLGDEDDVENLQLAWEMLDLSRSILEKRVSSGGGDTARALLSEVHLTLGEVALESETYDKAVIDMHNCLSIQKQLYKNDDRRIAETHYQIGLANSLSSDFEEAITHFKNAANILETRIRTLESADDATLKKTNHATQQSAASEVKELKELLPEINDKIQDMMDYKAETMRRLREQLLPTNGATTSAGSSSQATQKQASDISHLIKRKRKSSQEDGAAPAKNSKP